MPKQSFTTQINPAIGKEVIVRNFAWCEEWIYDVICTYNKEDRRSKVTLSDRHNGKAPEGFTFLTTVHLTITDQRTFEINFFQAKTAQTVQMCCIIWYKKKAVEQAEALLAAIQRKFAI